MANIVFPQICYWCGGIVDGEEHVPPANLFVVGNNLNLKKVPSCKVHNQDFAKLDDRMKVYLQAASENPIAIAAFKDKTLRGLIRSPGLVKTISMNTELIKVGNEERKKFNIAKLDVQTYFEKITRGIYFYHFKKPLDAERKVYSFSLQILDDELNYEEMLHSILPELESDKTTKGIYENPKVFCYKYIIPENSEYFLLYMKFYDSIEVISMYGYQS